MLCCNHHDLRGHGEAAQGCDGVATREVTLMKKVAIDEWFILDDGLKRKLYAKINFMGTLTLETEEDRL